MLVILCPLDFSPGSEALVCYAAALAAAQQATLLLLHVLEPTFPPQVAAAGDVALAIQLARTRVLAERAGARVCTAVRQGPPAPVILAEARRWPTSLLVIGAHGRTRLHRFLMGGTAEEVVRKASCPTLLVKQPPTDWYALAA